MGRGFSNIPSIFLFILLAGIAETLTSADTTTPKERCDLFRGEWIHDPSDPPYTNNTCDFMFLNENCMRNGRPDSGYLHWRWKPYGCDFRPSLPENFLDAMLGKRLGFVGDSLVRNQVESLACILSQVKEPVYKLLPQSSKSWYFPAYNFTLTFIWSRQLLKSVGSVSAKTITLYLDVLDTSWTSQYRNFDYVVISTGHWFSRPAIMIEDNKIVGCNRCRLANVTELGFLNAYRRSLQLSFRFMMAEPGHRPELVMYRSFTPGHFEHGSWNTGGYCNRTVPYKEGEFEGHKVDRAMEAISEEEFADAAAGGGGRMRYMDVYHLSLLRPDGHPDRYEPKKGVCDCLHWCMPGPVDTWNYLMMEMILGDDFGPRQRSF